MNLGTVVVGGGTGFIGKAVTSRLKAKGYDVMIISRKTGPSHMTWNDLQKEGLPNGTRAVINLAGQNVLDPTRFWSPGFKQNVWASRVSTTRYLAEAIKKMDKKPTAFVTTSGVGFYPPSDSAEYTEEAKGGDFDFLSRLCTDWEAAAQIPPELNVRTVTFRCGVVLGRSGGMIQQLFYSFYFGLGGPISPGTQFMPWIHVEDIASLYLYAVENASLSGIVNGVAPQVITNREFAKAFGRALRRPTFITLPTFVLNMLFSPERAKIMTEGQKVIPKKANEAGFQFKYPDIDSACAQLSS